MNRANRFRAWWFKTTRSRFQHLPLWAQGLLVVLGIIGLVFGNVRELSDGSPFLLRVGLAIPTGLLVLWVAIPAVATPCLGLVDLFTHRREK